MSIPEQIFKAYDIRGLVNGELEPEVVEAIGRAYIVLTGAKNVAIGYDMRPESPAMVEHLTRGVNAMGSNVVNIGLCSSPMLYYAVGMHDEIDGGLMVTASHNPAGWNGIKLSRGDVSPIGTGSGMEELKQLVIDGNFVDAEQRGSNSTMDTKEGYLDAIFQFVGEVDVSDMKLVADAANGMVGMLLPDVQKRLGTTIGELYWDLDGTFPNHEANPIKHETLVDLQKRVIDEGATLGLAYDADGDRIGLIDEKGQIVAGDSIMMLVAREILLKHPHSLILGNVQCSRDVNAFVEKLGGTYKMTPVGHAKIKREMRESGAVFAGELSAHLYYADFFNVESTELTTLLLLKLVSDSEKSLSELVAEVKSWHASGEINFHVEDKLGTIAKVKEMYASLPDADLSEIDGVRIDYPTWWFGVRASNTEPVLRINIEAEKVEDMEMKRDEIIAMIESNGGKLE
ncbi:MAG TPA: phosphomannomutase/phosphoglucomutase [Patescibacteria group bacterium]|nr:phosphomannomutase/phosphoglucomutase [Patescibacteria group bacterium]